MKKIIFATNNIGKVAEVRRMMESENVEVFSLKDIGLSVEIEENGSTFMENAIMKANGIRKILEEKQDLSETIIIADDSGLEIDFLNGEPGIYSARYLGEDTSYTYKNQVILERLENVPLEERGARFVCAMAAVDGVGTVLEAQGVMEGTIACESVGGNGFGYDPIFFLGEYNKTSAELEPDEKNKISHRGKALREIYNILKEKQIL